MGEYLDQIPENLHSHIKAIAKDVHVEGDALEKVAQAWLEKKDAFEEKTAEMGMEEVGSIGKEDEEGFLALTYSGSLINVGPVSDGVRSATYSSIGMRTDIPESAENDGSVLAKDATIDDTIDFEVGPVKSTSKIFKIAVCKSGMSVDEQVEVLTKATTILEEEFITVNKTLMM